MAINDLYFANEIREGFFIPGMVKRSFAVQMDILEHLDSLCQKYGLKWFADYGTLMGACRHGGFIPWDDDLDICMFRKDIEKLLDAADELPEGYKVLTLKNEPDYDNFLIRVTNTDAIHLDNDYLLKHQGFPFVSGIDIFPLDNIFDDKEKEDIRKTKVKFVYNILNNLNKPSIGSNNEIIKAVEETTGYLVDRTVPLANSLYKVLEQLFIEANNQNSEFVTVMPFWCAYDNHKFPRYYFDKRIKLSFEDRTIYASPAFDAYLSNAYGSWQIANRVGGIHDYPFYGSQENVLIEKTGKRFYGYSDNEYKSIFENKDRTRRAEHKELLNQNAKVCELLNKLLSLVEKSCNAEDYASVATLLEKSQELSIALGTSIENKYGEGTETVGLLENYCEAIYELFVAINSDSKDSEEISYKVTNMAKILSVITANCNRLSNDRFLLFIVSSLEQWNAVSLFVRDRVKSDYIYIINAPYYIKDSVKNIKADSQNFSKLNEKLIIDSLFHTDKNDLDNKDIQKVRFVDFSNEKVNELFSKIHFDEIYITDPFDDSQSAITVPESLYSGKLKDYSDKLIYIHSFDTDDISERDQKSYLNAETYIYTPAVLWADEVLVPSENLRNIYIEKLAKKFERIESKELVSGYSFFDKKIAVNSLIKRARDCSVSKNNEQNKKVMLFYFGFSLVYTDGEKAVNKLKSVLELFKVNENKLNIIWVIEEDIENILEDFGNIYADEFNNIINDYKKKTDTNIKLVSVKNMNDIEAVAKECDAFYGNGGMPLTACVRRQIPIMIMNINL